jgi:superfamily I DNA/RNA helicase
VLFVDEAQDLDRTQLDLAILLAGDERDIFLVGDDDQTIYAWRLADVRRVLGLAARLPGLRRVDLETNHRCAPEVVARAARLVAHNCERFEKRIVASPRATGSVVLVPDSGDETTRARWLLANWPPGSAEPANERRAVLARTNRELVPYAAVALGLGIPYLIESDGLLTDDPDIAAFLQRLAATGGSQVSERQEREHKGRPPTRSLLPFLRDSAVRAGLAERLTSAVLAWAAPYPDLATFRAALEARRAAGREMATAMPMLTLATIHGTKGLEWDHVACIGHDEGAFPSGRAIGEAADPRRALEEERRLAYVAWTRARRTLTIVYDPGAPSLFLREAFDAGELA